MVKPVIPKQDMPPTGGFKRVEWRRHLPARGLSGFATFGLVAGIMAVGTWVSMGAVRDRNAAREARAKAETPVRKLLDGMKTRHHWQQQWQEYKLKQKIENSSSH